MDGLVADEQLDGSTHAVAGAVSGLLVDWNGALFY